MPTVDQLGSTTDKIADKPVAYVAAFFALAFLALLALHLRTVAQLSKDHAAQLLNLAVRFERLGSQTFELMRRLDAFLPKSRRKTLVDPTQVTVIDVEGAADGDPDKD